MPHDCIHMHTVLSRPVADKGGMMIKNDCAALQRVFNTGWFRECVPDAVDTRDGVKLIIKVGADSRLLIIPMGFWYLCLST
jgi:hypothetical protein